ncbi:hypothetical protein [Nocardioides sp. YIM 152315]|uniref:hypothetical protein n=1 Tax=Nocardioides sp. YIM 152315 TaxID=3031760 RepID=UPI0023DAD14F|nr:hypothetical protein [Nocardioides sp. YIM 152315]MDF1605134.1 hypothetical protein [Nocardioides sp. YIM 152315]
MDRPPIREFRGRAKWAGVIGNLLLAGLGVGLAWIGFAAVPGDVAAVRALAWYTVAAALVTLGLAIATAATRRLPALRESRLEGAPALVARSWAAEWWYAVALDAGLVVLAGVLVGLGVDAGGSWVLGTVAVALVGAYFLVRVILTITGRRRNHALWLTPHEIVHDAPWGRERVRREQVVRVRPATASAELVLEVDGPVGRQVCPRPWRRTRLDAGSSRIVADCSMTAHEAGDLAAWLGSELGVCAAGR